MSAHRVMAMSSPPSNQGVRMLNPGEKVLSEIVRQTVALAYELTAFLGRRVRVELTTNGLGFTVPQLKGIQDEVVTVCVNPIAFLQQHPRAESIFRGLGYHETGHQKYDSDGQQRSIDKAKREGFLDQTNNLLLDEWLERQLRSERPDVGRDLQILINYAFKEPVFGSSRLSQWRYCVRKHLSSDDQRVIKALDLIPKNLAKLDVWEVLDLSREAYKLLADGSEFSDQSEAAGKGFGKIKPALDPSDLPPEVLALLTQMLAQAEVESGGTGLNDGETTSFNRIRNIKPVEPNESIHQQAVKLAANEIRRLRQVFSSLGIHQVETPDQLAGHDLVDDVEKVVIDHDPTIFVDEVSVQDADLDIQVVLDCSGSMASKNRAKITKHLVAKNFGILTAESIREIRGCSNHFWGFTEKEIFDCGTAKQCSVSGLKTHVGNNDAAALWHAAQASAKSGKTHRVLVMISDGLPSDCTWSALNSLVSKLERQGYVVVQVAVDKIAKPAFRHFVDLSEDDLNVSTRKFGRLIEKLVTSQL